MHSLKTIEKTVFEVLTTIPASRDSDMELYYLVCKEFYFQKHGKPLLLFENVMRNYKDLGVPCFESVRRARQKIQASYPSLGCSPKTRRARHKAQGMYKNYSKEAVKKSADKNDH